MPHIVIDGYNYINRIRPSGIQGASNLEAHRKSLLDKLVLYKKQKPNKITVVFDAYKGFSLTRQRENYKGIDVVYTKENETADEVIIEWIMRRPSGLIVVTSDRAILDKAKSHGIAFLTPVRFEEVIMGNAVYDSKEEDFEETPRSEKKGNPRRLPKKLRKTGKVISKI